MLRLGRIVGLAAACVAAAACNPAENEDRSMAEISLTYAESVALAAISPDGEQEVSVRLGRFPGRGRASLWVAAYVGSRRYAGAGDAELSEFRGVTPVEADLVQFKVVGDSAARFDSRDRYSPGMVGTVRATARVHESLHPPPGVGTVPISIEAEFRASHEGVRVRPGRLEVMGSVIATVETPDGRYPLEIPGKWHEQTGERPRFAPAFTYMALQGGDLALLASRGARGAWGYALIEGKVIPVVEFAIDPLGSPRRTFRVQLEDGQRIEGEARIKRETSVPIEGQRRPGATVVTSTNLGNLVGHLNDWNPRD